MPPEGIALSAASVSSTTSIEGGITSHNCRLEKVFHFDPESLRRDLEMDIALSPLDANSSECPAQLTLCSGKTGRP